MNQILYFQELFDSFYTKSAIFNILNTYSLSAPSPNDICIIHNYQLKPNRDKLYLCRDVTPIGPNNLDQYTSYFYPGYYIQYHDNRREYIQHYSAIGVCLRNYCIRDSEEIDHSVKYISFSRDINCLEDITKYINDNFSRYVNRKTLKKINTLDSHSFYFYFRLFYYFSGSKLFNILENIYLIIVWMLIFISTYNILPTKKL